MTHAVQQLADFLPELGFKVDLSFFLHGLLRKRLSMQCTVELARCNVFRNR